MSCMEPLIWFVTNTVISDTHFKNIYIQSYKNEASQRSLIEVKRITMIINKKQKTQQKK